MTKKMIFGMLLASIGAVFTLFCLAYAVSNPWNYNGIGGLYGSFLGTHTLVPFLISLAGMTAGLVICGLEAFRKE